MHGPNCKLGSFCTVGRRLQEVNVLGGLILPVWGTVERVLSKQIVHIDNLSGASTILFSFALDRGLIWESAYALLEEKQKDESSSTNSGFYESKREWLGRRHFLLAFEGEMPLAQLKDKYRKLSSLEKARRGWEDEYDVSLKQCMHGPNCKLGSFCTVGRRLQEVNVLGGLILPVWGTVERVLSKQARQSHQRIRIVRIVTTTDNQRIVGLLIPDAAVEPVLQGRDIKEEVLFSCCNAKFMLDEEEHFKEQLFERLRLFGEHNKEQDFAL
ncbi:protein FORGETTER 1-like isoform X2 [Nicotiana tomentosiformis]